jgi:hypothetical protein
VDEPNEGIIDSPAFRRLGDAISQRLVPPQKTKIGLPHQVPVLPREEIDYEGLAQAVRESAQAKEAAKRSREDRMIAALEEVRRELKSANQREASAVQRAAEAEAREEAAQAKGEARERIMLKATLISTVVGFVSCAAAVVTLVAT